MTKYEKELLEEKWYQIRDRRLSMDWHMCQKCMSGKRLQVHHRYYIEGAKAWEYPLNALITLCDRCHELEHDLNGIRMETPLEACFRRIYDTADRIKRLDAQMERKSHA